VAFVCKVFRILSGASLSVRALSLAKRNPIAVPTLAAAACFHTAFSPSHLATLQAGSFSSKRTAHQNEFFTREKFYVNYLEEKQRHAPGFLGRNCSVQLLARNCSGQRASAPSVKVHRRLAAGWLRSDASSAQSGA
jgi:hypothetical protein